MLVKDVMARKVLTVRADTSFEKIVKTIVKHKISGISVVDKNRKLVGVISEKDLLYKLFPSQREFYKDINYYKNFKKIELEAASVKKLTAKNIMTKKLVTVEPSRHVLVACSLMSINNVRRLPVVEQGKLVGIVTMGMLYKKYLSSILDS